MDRIQEIARRHNLALLEDACEAIGAEYDSRKAGSFGDLAILGFYPNKQITTGEGGCVLVRDRDLADRLRSLRNQGRATRAPAMCCRRRSAILLASWFEHAEIGYNYRLSELAAALGRAQLGRIDEILAMRRAVAERYQSLLETISALELPPVALPRLSISWFVYVVRLHAELSGLAGRFWISRSSAGGAGEARDCHGTILRPHSPAGGVAKPSEFRSGESFGHREGRAVHAWRCHFSTGSQWSSKKRWPKHLV